MPSATEHVVGGIDTHKETHHATVLTVFGRFLADQQFPATGAGHRDLLDWLRSFGTVDAIGVEGTGSYGAALTRLLTSEGERVIEVNRPARAMRRLHGKSDQLDSEQAARSVLAGTATATPKAKSGAVESIRILRVTRSTAVKARTQAMNALHSIIVTAPECLREELRSLKARELINRCSRLRPETSEPATLLSQPDRMLIATTKIALRDLALRWQSLDTDIKRLSSQVADLVEQHAPTLTALHGVGAEIAGQLLITAGDNPERMTTEAAFAKLCGAAPQPASSGKTTGRHRLSRGGDRAANSALYIIAITRMRRHEPTRAYVARRTAEGLSKREILRCLKRFIAREVFAALPRPGTKQSLTAAA
ncbi:IS110 family transposase [Nocardia sp. CWNU-33]|uniref:IS110 family transposase n=1 Tax=Nocardia sp. CWNU-33 TaxID=3392117 RepID=UPI00398F3489